DPTSDSSSACTLRVNGPSPETCMFSTAAFTYAISDPVSAARLKGTRGMAVRYKYVMRDPYVLRADGTWAPPAAVSHRDTDYTPAGSGPLGAMQAAPFWSRGRHRFILHFARQIARGFAASGRRPDAVDLGGGCGGWVSYLAGHAGGDFGAIALADSSETAL